MSSSLSNVKLKNQNKMKTKNNISNLKKMAVTIAATMVLTTSTFAGSTSSKNEMVSASRLESLMTATEQSIRFVAPAEESQEVFYAVEELNALAETTEASVKYVAPAAEEETEEVAVAIEGLDRLASVTEAAVAFKAPRADGSIESDTKVNQMVNFLATK
jgi:hypothetical protein